MHKRLLILFFPCLFMTGCGIKGPLYLPPDPNDSYLSRIGKQINEWTGEDMVGEAPESVEERQQALPTDGNENGLVETPNAVDPIEARPAEPGESEIIVVNPVK